MLNRRKESSMIMIMNQFSISFFFYFGRVYTNAEKLLSFELFGKVEIQYYRGYILTVNVLSSMKAKLCGICSLPFNAVPEYAYCK